MKIFSKRLIEWYNLNHRDLPWRNTMNPYFIWVSEIILQQTRISQGLNYYLNFIKHFPNIESLARAKEDDIMKIWQGLGYYTRARNMHITSKEIAYTHEGHFPTDYKELKKLKGIGDYTAAAIASFAYNEKVPVVDGNVYRFLGRYLGIKQEIQSPEGKRVYYLKALELIDEDEPGTFNQAMMEYGALYCTPTSPKCNECIFVNECYAFNNNAVKIFPVKGTRVKQENRFFNYMIISDNQSLLLSKREQKDIWKALYEFPLIETGKKLSSERIFYTKEWKDLFQNSDIHVEDISKEFVHILTHQKIHARFFLIKVDEIPLNMKNKYITVSIGDIKNFAIPKLIENYLKNLKII